MDEGKRRRKLRGSGESEKRTHTVSVRVDVRELALLDERRALLSMRRGEYMRVAALAAVPRPIPAVNVELRAELSRSAANLNQIAHRMNAAELSGVGMPSVDEIRAALSDFRLRLIGLDDESEG